MEEPQSQSLEKINRNVLAPAVIFAAVSAWFFQTFIMGSDLFWHLAAGRDIWERGGVPHTDPFSHTFGGKEWTNHEWLWDCIYWKIYQINTDAVAWFTIGIYIVIFALMFLLAYEATKSVFASGVAIWIAAITCHWFFDIRPHPVTLIMSAIVLVTRNKKWAIYLWPPLIVLWTNLHAGFIFGIGMVGLLTLVRTAEKSVEEKRFTILWPEWISVAICVFIWMLNPYGPYIAEFQLDYFFKDSPYRGLVEWNPPMFGLNPFFFEGAFWWLVVLSTIGASCTRSKKYILSITAAVLGATILFQMKGFSEHALGNVEEAKGYAYLMVALMGGSFVLGVWKPQESDSGLKIDNYVIVLSMVALHLACGSRRFIPLFCVTSAPLAASCLAYFRDRLYEFVPAAKSQWVGISTTGLGVVAAAVLWGQVRFGESLLRDWAMAAQYPEEQVAWINEVKPEHRVLNYYNWGGFIILHAPGYQLFFDGRANTLYDEEIYHDYHGRLLPGKFNRQLLSKYESDVALIPNSNARTKFAARLARLNPPWKLMHQGRATLMLPPGSPLLEKDLPTVEEVVPDGVEATLTKANVEFNKGNEELAIELLEEGAKKFYYDFRLHQNLARYYFERKDPEKVLQIVDQGIADNPRRAATLYGLKANYLQKMGRLSEARDAYARSFFRGPFGSNRARLGAANQVKQLDNAIRRKSGS